MNKELLKPKVTINVACSLDGIIATNKGPLDLSNEEDWLRVHDLRNNSDAILVGINTIINDNPGLKIKRVDLTPPHPYRVVLDSNARIPLDAKVLREQEVFPTILFVSNITESKFLELKEKGVSVEVVKEIEKGFLDLEMVLDILYRKYNVRNLMVEGGGKIITSFVIHKLVDEMIIFYAPILVGSIDGVPLFPKKAKEKILEHDRIKNIIHERIGDGFLIKIQYGENKCQ
ncbi:MAG: dihydrofolate reductase family protein [Candidatus Heimdallarchaeum aukensis]|uniref:Dihydrofolate reductase family protein n=1 Tax=Candidatus Heimdallarchaeum aukensis TaxID=2876573 RepID=A0A9Y1FL70_9ARCH|nr:MAG: dihydrofolate reductase family protein [Candidatus Heimdallarchaeum aukensis]